MPEQSTQPEQPLVSEGVQVGQVYRDNDPRAQGRTVQVRSLTSTGSARCVVLTNAEDIQAMLDDPDGHPGSRSYQPRDCRGRRTTLKTHTLRARYTLVSQGDQ